MSVLTCSWQCIDIFINRWQKKKWLIVLWKNWWLTFRILPGRPALTATGIVGKVLAEWKNKNLVDFWNRFLTTVFGFKFAVALASFVFNFNTKWCRFWFLVEPHFWFHFFVFFYEFVYGARAKLFFQWFQWIFKVIVRGKLYSFWCFWSWVHRSWWFECSN